MLICLKQNRRGRIGLNGFGSQPDKNSFSGTWKENQVEIKGSDEFLPEISDEMKKVAKKRFEERKAKNPNIFDGPAVHLKLSHSVISPDYLFLALGKITYSLYDVARKEYAEKFGWKTLPTGMGMNAVVLTSDSKIIMHHRFPWVDHKAKIGTIGAICNGKPPFGSLRRELKEELGIRSEEIVDIVITGISNRLDERVNYELTFIAEISLNIKEIKERQKLVAKKEGEVFFLNREPEELKRYLRENYQKIVSSGFGALVMTGHHWWGSNWSQI